MGAPTITSRVLGAALIGLAVLGAGSFYGCELYHAPPAATLVGLQNGLLSDPDAALIVTFDRPVDPTTLHVKIARYKTDVEGNLYDEIPDSPVGLSLLFTHDPYDPDFGGKSELDPAGTTLRIVPKTTLPIGDRLVLLLEPGLADTTGEATAVRKRILFSYEFKLHCVAPSKVVASGAYFWLFDVKTPIATQVQLWALIDVDPATGAFNGQFTNADRNRDGRRCASTVGTCKSTDACRLLPAPACVAPSERAGTVDEYPDYLPNSTPPTGYSFNGRGCIEDQPDGTAAFVNVPVDVEVQEPAVTLRACKMTTLFTKGADGVVRGTGTISAGDVLLGTISSGAAEGGLNARSVVAAEVPPGVPPPPKK
jgi:hypothetical protein